MIVEILGWILTCIHAESAIIGWKIAGKGWLFTLLSVEGVSILSVCFSLWLIDILLFILKKIFKINLFLKIKRNAWYKRLSEWNRERKTNSVSFIKKTIQEIEMHPYLTLFIFNLVPFVPYLTFGTVATVKLLQVRFGLLVILAGNAVKILYLTTIIFLL